MTHGPPVGHGDLTSSNQRAGCVDLLSAITERVKPIYHIFGHIHESYGITTNDTTTFINASTCTYSYRPDNEPIVFDLPRRKIKTKVDNVKRTIILFTVILSGFALYILFTQPWVIYYRLFKDIYYRGFSPLDDDISEEWPTNGEL
jgi:hypothetical protein